MRMPCVIDSVSGMSTNEGRHGVLEPREIDAQHRLEHRHADQHEHRPGGVAGDGRHRPEEEARHETQGRHHRGPARALCEAILLCQGRNLQTPANVSYRPQPDDD